MNQSMHNWPRIWALLGVCRCRLPRANRLIRRSFGYPGASACGCLGRSSTPPSRRAWPGPGSRPAGLRSGFRSSRHGQPTRCDPDRLMPRSPAAWRAELGNVGSSNSARSSPDQRGVQLVTHRSVVPCDPRLAGRVIFSAWSSPAVSELLGSKPARRAELVSSYVVVRCRLGSGLARWRRGPRAA